MDDEEYEKDTAFSQAQLGALTENLVMKWFNFEVYEVPEPLEGHDLNPLIRSNSIKYWKQALSFFMPNRLTAWNQLTGYGNPTRSQRLNDLIKKIKRKEVRGQGAPSRARRSITGIEYRRVMAILKEEGQDILWKYGIPAMMNYQLHMISRIDCATQAMCNNLKKHAQFDFALKAKLEWSKNVTEEQDAPWQAVLASNDHTYCVHLFLGLWIELFAKSSPTAPLTPFLFTFSDDTVVPRGGVKPKTWVQNINMSDIFKRPEFVDTGPLGSHSVRKFASTECRKKGATKDEKDLRGRWKSASRVSDTYDDIELPYPDAKVAALLCIGGPVKYQLRDDAGIDDDWILSTVMPHGCTKIDNNAAVVLGRAVLWYAFTAEGIADMPPMLYQRICNAYALLNNDLEATTNPVKKIPLVVSGNDGEVYMDEIPDDLIGGGDGAAPAGDGGTVAPVGGGFVDRPIRLQLLAMHSQLLGLRWPDEEMRQQLRDLAVQSTRQYQTMNANIRRIAMNPVRCAVPAAGNGGAQNNAGGQAGGQVGAGGIGAAVAALSSTPRDFYLLWQEYQVGIGGRKAARLFSAFERGGVKHKFARRKVVWSTIDRLVRGGIHSNVAIDRIYNTYGCNSTVTSIINRMLADRRNHTVPANLG